MALNPLIALQVKTPAELQSDVMGNAAKQQAIDSSRQQMQQSQQLQPYKMQEAQQTLDSNKLTQLKQKNDLVGQLLSGVNDQASYDSAKQQAAQYGLPIDHLPPQYDPGIVKNLQMRAMGMDKYLTLQLQQQGAQETQRHNLATENNNRMKITGGMGMTNVDPETGDVTNVQSPGFGFQAQAYPPVVFKNMANEDSKRRVAGEANRPIANNVLNILDTLEPNLDKFTTGAGGDIRLNAEKAAKYLSGGTMYDQTATAGNDIEKSTNDLANELGKFQHMPGNRGSVLGLQTILASKPGVTQDPQTNRNIIAGLRAKATDALLSDELQQQYRQASPYKITDSNVDKLDDALKDIYPLYTVDKKTNQVSFNADNADKIRDSMSDAIANPQKYMQMAKQAKNSGGQNHETNLSSNNSVPPADQRKLGQVYQTPKGSMKWMGNGWLPVGDQ